MARRSFLETQDSALTILEYSASFFPLRETLSHDGGGVGDLVSSGPWNSAG